MDVKVFFYRECFLLLLCFFFFIYREEKTLFIEQDLKIREVIHKKYPITRFEGPLAIASVFSIFFMVNSLFSSICGIVFFFGSLICLFYCFMVFYIVYCVSGTPEVKDFYNIKKSIKVYGVCSVHTAASFAHVCKLCGKGALAFGLGVFFGPKLMIGDPFYRGDFWNEITFPYTGLKARYDYEMAQATYLLHRCPETKSLFIQEDGWINVDKMEKIAKERNVVVPRPFDVNHNVNVGWWSKWW